MIIVTGAYGFIASYLVGELNALGLGRSIIVVDDFYKHRKEVNLDGKIVRDWIHRDLFVDWFKRTWQQVDCVFHLGARTDTAEQNKELFSKLNLNYSIALWQVCAERDIPFYYASSAATYGDGSLGFSDNHNLTKDLMPLNPYGQSKLDFDQWVLSQDIAPTRWAGFRFFNVFGPNEYHKARMASVVYHAFNQIKSTGSMKLFRSHKSEIKDGEQRRDFVYVKDVATVLLHTMNNVIDNGIYNLGSGQANTFNDLVSTVFEALELSADIAYIDIPSDIRSSYQYYTQADMTKLQAQSKDLSFTPFKEAIMDYTTNYLMHNNKIR